MMAKWLINRRDVSYQSMVANYLLFMDSGLIEGMYATTGMAFRET